MAHEINFCNVETGWHNALPLGNGKMGAMVYYRDRRLCIALNQYDCYYGLAGTVFEDPARREKTLKEMETSVLKARKEADYDRSHYLRTLAPDRDEGRPVYSGGSYPQGGEVILPFSEEVDGELSLLSLSVEEARVRFRAGGADRRVEAEIFVAEADGIVIRLSQTCESLWGEIGIWRQEARGQEQYTYDLKKEENRLVMRCGLRQEGAEEKETAFVQETAVFFPEKGEKMTVTASMQPGKDKARQLSERLWQESEEADKAHRARWKRFWKSRVFLPDSYLETLWHLYVYLMGCCSGEGSSHIGQACGLSGLWDIRRPCMWGSMWYWDVNIQTAFYGAFASNHMEQVKVFCEGFLSYREEIYRFAERIYGKRGWAPDYPHPLYHCIQPWCALFLWKYYAYTKDKEFLEKKAYPVFVEILDFYREISEIDEKGIRHLAYDICPEQGPVAEDTVITIAALKELIVCALKAAAILQRPQEEIGRLQGLLDEMPDYALTKTGERWKDSGMASDNLFLRHPSVLMPVFPAGEVHMASLPHLRRLADNTIRYAEKNTETGTFGFSWIASAAARMGAGESAVRILYEKGLDFMTHSNGLGYEESERFINFCHLTKPANYLPVMCEMAGGVTETVNLLLLQETDGVLCLFPALPDGKDSFAEIKTQYQCDEKYLSAGYGPWTECGFEGLLAPGGFEVSAKMQEGRVSRIRIYCKDDGVLRLRLPTEFAKEAERARFARLAGNALEKEGFQVFEKQVKAGEELCFGKKTASGGEVIFGEKGCGRAEAADMGFRSEGRAVLPAVLTHRAAHTRRRTFIGENEDTAFYKAVDSMVCPYGFAEKLRYGMTPYVFDFTEDKGKNYDDAYERQVLEAGRTVLHAGGPRPVGAVKYLPYIGYGFLPAGALAGNLTEKGDSALAGTLTECGDSVSAGNLMEKGDSASAEGLAETAGGREIRIKRRSGPDSLRRDFAEGGGSAFFGVGLPAGKYDILVISGDKKEQSVTHLAVPGSGLTYTGKVQKAGRYQCRLMPVMHERDGILAIRIDTNPGLKWKLNAVFINKEYMIL